MRTLPPMASAQTAGAGRIPVATTLPISRAKWATGRTGATGRTATRRAPVIRATVIRATVIRPGGTRKVAVIRGTASSVIRAAVIRGAASSVIRAVVIVIRAAVLRGAAI